MHGDRVVARIERIKDGGPRRRPRSSASSSARTASLVGRYDRDDDGMGYVVPFDRRVLMDIQFRPAEAGSGASPGEMVIVELTRWPTPTRGAVGRVAEVLGDIDAPGVDTEIIIRKYGIPDAHSRRGDRRGACGSARAVAERDIRGRTDFRAVPTVTIDGEHARDFDDAITIEKLPNGHYWLGVHIADVVALRAGGQRARSRRRTSAARRSTSPSAPCTCSRRSWRPASAASTRTSIGSCSRA